jgi:hypothetical protein
MDIEEPKPVIIDGSALLGYSETGSSFHSRDLDPFVNCPQEVKTSLVNQGHLRRIIA